MLRKSAPRNESDNKGRYIEYLGTKPPKVFEISSKFASNNESDNKRKYMLLGGEAPKTFKVSSKFASQNYMNDNK